MSIFPTGCPIKETSFLFERVIDVGLFTRSFLSKMEIPFIRFSENPYFLHIFNPNSYLDNESSADIL